MAITITQASAEPRAFSVGPLKMEILSWSSSTSADTSVVVTSPSMSTVAFAVLTGAVQTAAALSGKVATITIAQTAQQSGQIILFGR